MDLAISENWKIRKKTSKKLTIFGTCVHSLSFFLLENCKLLKETFNKIAFWKKMLTKEEVCLEDD